MSLSNHLDSSHPNQQFVLLQSSVPQSSLPLLRHLIARGNSVKKLLFCFLHSPPSLVADSAASNVQVHDYLDNVPGYTNSWSDPFPRILKDVEAGQCVHDTIICLQRNNVAAMPPEPASLPIEVIIDSVDTLLEDNGSPSETYKFLRSLMALISARSSMFARRINPHNYH